MCKKYQLWFCYFLILSLVNVGLALFNISMAFAEENIEYRFERSWPQLEQPWYFDQPTDIAVAPDSSVYIADTYNHRIQQFSANGNFIRTWGNRGLEEGQFTYPGGIAVATNGHVYVADTVNHRIQQFSADGVFIRAWGGKGAEGGQFNEPHGLVIAGDGSVYVTDYYNHRIQKFTAEGDFIEAWGTEGSENGQFNRPADIAIASDGSIYITDYHRIQKFSTKGDFLWAWESQGIGYEGEISHVPIALAIASNGNIYLVEPYNHRIQLISAEGALINTLGGSGKGNRQFSYPEAIDIASNGAIYIVDSNNSRIQQFTAEGGFVRSWSAGGTENGQFFSPEGLAVASDNSVYVTDTVNHRIQRFNENGDFIQTWGNYGSESGQLSFPSDIAVASNGNVYVLDSGNKRIQVFNADGEFIKTWGSTGTADGEFNTPSGLAIAPDDSIYVADTFNHRIQQFSADGVFIQNWGSEGSGNGKLSHPSDLVVATDGSIYVVDSKNNRIQHFSDTGSYIRSWGSEGTANGQFQSPKGISISTNGYIYVVDSKNHRIQQFNTDGGFIRSWGGKGNGNGLFNLPNNIAVAPNDSIYIVDKKNHRIQKFTPSLKTSMPHPHKAIILAGGGETFANGRSNSIWDGTWQMTQMAYKALIKQGFSAHKDIKFLTAGKTQLDNQEVATKENLRLAITEWASDATDVIIYLSNHGGPGKFKINDSETLTSEELNDWVTQLEQHLPGKLTLVIEACNSASFFPQLAKPGRILLASAKADQNAVISNNGLVSFSYTFWSEIATGATVQTAFIDARQALSAISNTKEVQIPQAEIDGNGLFSQQQDFEQLANYCLGACNGLASSDIKIESPMPTEQFIDGETGLEFQVTVTSTQSVDSAWAIIQRPDDISIDSSQPLNFDKIPLTCNTLNQCQGKYNRFDFKGEYHINFYAMDKQGAVSFPITVMVSKTSGIDVYPVKYDEVLATIYLRDVEYLGQHFQVALEAKGDHFVLVTASPTPQTFKPSAQFNEISNQLIIPHALAFGKPYEARLKHLGDFEFSLESAKRKLE